MMNGMAGRGLSRLTWGAVLGLAGVLWGGHLPTRLFTVQDGLVRNWIIRIRRDSVGYLWICTAEGLSVFDGSGFSNFSTVDGLPSRLINDVLQTRGGRYWIATSRGLSRFDPSARTGDRFRNFVVGDSGAANTVNALLEDSAHDVWCATDAGLFRFPSAAREIHPEFVPLEGGRRPPIRALLEDSRHRLWAAGNDGLYLRSPDGGVRLLATGPLMALLADARGRLWAGGDGLSEVDLDGASPAILARYRRAGGKRLFVAALEAGEGGGIWIGAQGSRTEHSLFRFYPDVPATGRFRAVPLSPAFDRLDVSSLATDPAGNLWIGLVAAGAVRISRTPTELYAEEDGLESRAVLGLAESRTGALYAITGTRHTFNEFTGAGFLPRPARLPAGFSDMGWGYGPIAVEDSERCWWVVSGQGVLRYPPADDVRRLAHTEPRFYGKRDGLPDDRILRLFEDSRGDMWVGTASGVARWSRADGRWAGVPLAAPSDADADDLPAVHAIAEDRSGSVWVGRTVSPTLFRVRGLETAAVDGAPAGFLNALLVDRRGRLWIGSSQGGLGRIDDPAAERPRIRTYTIVQGLSSNHVFSLAEDRWGRIYIAGGRGVDRLDPDTGRMRHFTESDGLPGGETVVVYCDNRGAVWFGSNLGLGRYDPEPDRAATPSTPLLRGLSINGETYGVPALGTRSVAGVELAPGHNDLAIDYRSLHFASGERLQYQYRLTGASDRWSAPTAVQTVRYANLAPGRYRFEVRSVGEGGPAGEPAFLEFRVPTPVWRQSWFIVLALALPAAAAYSLYRYRVNHLVAMERLRTRLASDLHDELGAGLVEIVVLSEVAKTKAPAAGADLLDQIARQARGLRGALGDVVWTVDPRPARLRDLVRHMREGALRVLETEDRRVAFKATEQDAELPADLRRNLLLFFKEAVTNVARHSAAAHVEIEIAVAADRLWIVIHDDGRGFDPGAPAAGRGVAGMHFRAKEMRGVLRVESARGHGTTLELSVPLGR